MPPETDPSEIENKPVLTDPQNWASRSHPELYAAVHNNNDPGQAGEISSDWSRYGSELAEASRTMNAVITSSETKWTGAAAEAARAAMKRLGDWVDETARTAVEVSNKVADQGRVMEAARAQMPAPVQFDWNKAAAALSQPGTPAFVLASADIAVANAASRAAHDQAVNVMATMENNSRQIDTSVPTFKPPFNPNTGQVEEPVMATARSGAAPALGNGVDALMSTHAQGAAVATPPSTAGAGAGGGGGAAAAANQSAPAAYSPSAPGYTGPGNPGGGSGGGGAGYTPQMPAYNPNTNTNVAAAYTPTAPGYSGPGNNGSTYTSSSGGGGGNSTYTPQMTGYNPSTGGANRPGNNQYTPSFPQTPVVGKDIANPNYTPQNPKGPAAYTPTAPGYNGPGGPGGPGGGSGGGGGGGGAGMKGGPMPYTPSMGGGAGGGGGGGGAFGGGAGGTGAGGAGGAMQSGGSAGVQGQGARPGMMGMGPGAASAAGAGMGAGAPMAGAPGAGGKGEDDKEHRSASYVMGGDLFEVPGENLPPSVIGAGKTKKKGPDAS